MIGGAESDGEVVTTEYGSPGAAVGLHSSMHGDLVDSVSYDEAGRMTALRFPAGGNLWRTQSYYPWTEQKNGGMLESLKVGLSESGGERLSRGYAYNSFGDITSLTEGATSNSFTYDGLGRLTSAYGRSCSYDAASRLTAFNGQSYGYGDAGPYHAVYRIGNADRFDYDANGNMTVRNKGLADQKTLVWDDENRLSQVQDNNGDLLEQYWYDLDGARVKKVSGTTTTYTFFAHYEEEVTGAVTTTVSHYSFGGLRIAVKRGSDLYHLHGDHLGSASLTTDGAGAATASRADYAYGADRSSSGDLQTDRTFTGQKSDASGLMYYNARYYDPALGTFISPDTLVADEDLIADYNRFLYGRGNPLKFKDPSGHFAVCFMGGHNPDLDRKTSFLGKCNEALNAMGYSRAQHGTVWKARNDEDAATFIEEEIRKLKSGDNPSSEPVVILCYSWGCPTAMRVVERLNDTAKGRVQVDVLVMFDPEDFLHPLGGIESVPNNVKLTFNFYAEDAEDYVLDETSTSYEDTHYSPVPRTNFGPGEGEFRGFEWTWFNGLNSIIGAIDISIPGGHYDFWGNIDFDDIVDWAKIHLP